MGFNLPSRNIDLEDKFLCDLGYSKHILVCAREYFAAKNPSLDTMANSPFNLLSFRAINQFTVWNEKYNSIISINSNTF